MTPRWIATEMPRADAAAARPAPATVPKLKKACMSGMSVLPISRSASAPSTFIITSTAPLPNPNSASPITTSGTDGRIEPPMPTETRPTDTVTSTPIMPARAPTRAISHGAAMRPRTGADRPAQDDEADALRAEPGVVADHGEAGHPAREAEPREEEDRRRSALRQAISSRRGRLASAGRPSAASWLSARTDSSSRCCDITASSSKVGRSAGTCGWSISSVVESIRSAIPNDVRVSRMPRADGARVIRPDP